MTNFVAVHDPIAAAKIHAIYFFASVHEMTPDAVLQQFEPISVAETDNELVHSVIIGDHTYLVALDEIARFTDSHEEVDRLTGYASAIKGV